MEWTEQNNAEHKRNRIEGNTIAQNTIEHNTIAYNTIEHNIPIRTAQNIIKLE